VSLDLRSVSAKWHRNASNCLRKMHECDGRWTTNIPRYCKMHRNRHLHPKSNSTWKHASSMPPSYSNATLTLTLTPTFGPVIWKLPHQLLLPSAMFTLTLAFLGHFIFELAARKQQNDAKPRPITQPKIMVMRQYRYLQGTKFHQSEIWCVLSKNRTCSSLITKTSWQRETN